MTVGQRIKAARISCGMTQARLCGNRITRSMLSMIENGNARPSLDLLEYFSQQLNMPAAYFLSDDENVFTIRRNAVIGEIRSRFSDKKYNSCIELCMSLGAANIDGEDELSMIMAYCSYHSGTACVGDLLFPAASDCFASALRYASLTRYPCEEVTVFAPAFLSFLSSLRFEEDNIPLWDAEFSAAERLCPEIAYLSLIRSPDVFREGLFAGHEDFALHITALLEHERGNSSRAIELMRRALGTRCSAFARLCILADMERILLVSLDYENASLCAEQRRKTAISTPTYLHDK